MRNLGAVVTVFCVLIASACDNTTERTSTVRRPPTTPSAEPPTAVAEKREAIVAAAKAFDYARLKTLLDPASFSYSFGESGDPVGYWRRLEEKGEVPILGDILPTVLAAPFAKQGNIYVWPAAYAKRPSAWTAADRRSLATLYSAKEIRGFERAGAYLGWRAGIRRDGTWLFFVAGD